MGNGVGLAFVVSAGGLDDDRFVVCLCLRVLTEYVSVFPSLSFKYFWGNAYIWFDQFWGTSDFLFFKYIIPFGTLTPP